MSSKHLHSWSLAIIDNQDIMGGELQIEHDIITLTIGYHMFMLVKSGETITLSHQFCSEGKFSGKFMRLLQTWVYKNNTSIPPEFGSLMARMDVNEWTN